MTRALPMLRTTEERYANLTAQDETFANSRDRDFVHATIVALLERTANPIELERRNPRDYQKYIGERKLETTDALINGNLSIFANFTDTKAFGGIKFIIRKIQSARANLSSTP